MAPLYSHRQFGRSMFAIGIVVGLLMIGIVGAVLGTTRGREQSATFWVLSLVPGFLACVVVLMFAWMEVRVTTTQIQWAFGAGFPSYTLELGDVTHAEATRTTLAYGIGVRITPKGWLYNVATGSAVAVTTPKKTVLIGTDDPAGLTSAIDAARHAQATSH